MTPQIESYHDKRISVALNDLSNSLEWVKKY